MLQVGMVLFDRVCIFKNNHSTHQHYSAVLLECPPAIRSSLEFYDPPLKAGRDPGGRLAMREGLVKRRGCEGVNAEP